jgi:hypothetical protein
MMRRRSLPGAPLRCRAVSTPTYDQLCGERINADDPGSEADPYSVDHPRKHRIRGDVLGADTACGPPPGPGAHSAKDWSWCATDDPDRPGKHRIRDDASGADTACGPPPGPGAHSAKDWSWCATDDPDRPGKHRIRDDAPGADTACGPGPGADFAEGWSWFGAGEPSRAGPANATRPPHSLAGTPDHGHPPAADQQSTAGQREASEQPPHALLPPLDYPCCTQEPGAVSTSRDKAGPLETLTVSELREPHDNHDSSHWILRRVRSSRAAVTWVGLDDQVDDHTTLAQ